MCFLISLYGSRLSVSYSPHNYRKYNKNKLYPRHSMDTNIVFLNKKAPQWDAFYKILILVTLYEYFKISA